MPDVIDPDQFGVSFSIKQCRNLSLDAKETLTWLIKDAGFRRFRLMSYWNEHEQEPGEFDFSELDWQIEMIEKNGGKISLCLGARQPRWPENHWPAWAWRAMKPVRDEALLKYIQTVIERYKDNKSIVSYQLENEALLVNFGELPEVDRLRLRGEHTLIKALDPDRPIIMSTSTSWGIPIRHPIPDIVGFSYYHTVYNSKRHKYTTAFHRPWLHRIRKKLIALIHNRPVFIHELQLEPWGPDAIWKMSLEEQDKSMKTQAIARNISLARQVGALPIDLWGGEWWYWRLKKHSDPTIWQAVLQAVS
jgi:hypothetical protein